MDEQHNEELVAKQEQMLQEKEKEIYILRQKIVDLEEELAEIQTIYENISESKSWRITAPLRKVKGWVRDNRLIYLIAKGIRSLRRNGIRETWRKVKSIGGLKGVLQNMLGGKKSHIIRKLRNADDISFSGLVKCARSNGATVLLPEVIEGYSEEKKRKILLVSHELDLTGAPVVMHNFAVSMIRNGDLPIIASPHAGKLSDNIAQNNIPVIIFDGIYSTDFVSRFASLFDIVVVGTIVGSPVINMLAGTSTPILWWIHEAEVSYNETMLEQIPEVQPNNVSIYCGGAYAEKVLLSHRPIFQPKQLLYHTVDMMDDISVASPVKKDDRLLFAMVGTMQERKGPDILADAILQLPKDVISQSRFLFIGRPVDKDVVQRIKKVCKRYPDNVEYWDEMPYDQLRALYKDMDCLICPSRDDPMPCTITEVLLLSVPVICSENCGYAPILFEMECGSVFADNDPTKLATEIKKVVKNRDVLKKMSAQARRTYETYFSEPVFDKSSQKAIADTIATSIERRKKTVSVVIPTYNAGEEGRKLFELLRGQEGLDELDIIVVDSGSKDNTVEIARQFDCKVIQIPNEEFSHSYARNLGAQHVTTNYILFMTQDAVPTSADWISKMVSAIQENNAVAASCREVPRPECDLYGCLSGYSHNQYMGILQHDRILQKPNLWNAESARKNAQINDIACIVERRVFLRYQFRGNYAEDLDLGIRLISDNYRLMLLSSTPVIHSHTRSAMYHFRRAIVDITALKRIIPEQPVRTISADQAYNRILTAAFMSFYCIRVLQEKVTESLTPKKLREKLKDIYSEAEKAARDITKEDIAKSIAQGLPCEDGGMLALMEEMLAVAPNVFFDPSSFYDVGDFIADQTIDYLEYMGTNITQEFILDITDTWVKRFGSDMGRLLAEYSITAEVKDKSLDRMIQKYSQGI